LAAAHSGLTSRVLDVTQTGASLPHTEREVRNPRERPSRPSARAPSLLLAQISTEDQFEFGIRVFLAGLEAQRPGAG
jgi:hypothetical protein